MSGEREDWNEGEDDDRHGEENRAANLFAGDERGFPSFLRSELPTFFIFRFFTMPKHVLRHDDGGVHQHADGDCDAG